MSKEFTIVYNGLSTEDSKDWVKNGPSSNLLLKAEKSGEYYAKVLEKMNGRTIDQKLTTSQIRAIFTKLKEIDAKGINDMKSDFLMLKPLVAYAAGRHKKEGLTKFKDNIINPGVDAVLEENGNIEKKFKNFVKLLEAVLAYHKANGGKDK